MTESAARTHSGVIPSLLFSGVQMLTFHATEACRMVRQTILKSLLLVCCKRGSSRCVSFWQNEGGLFPWLFVCQPLLHLFAFESKHVFLFFCSVIQVSLSEKIGTNSLSVTFGKKKMTWWFIPVFDYLTYHDVIQVRDGSYWFLGRCEFVPAKRFIGRLRFIGTCNHAGWQPRCSCNVFRQNWKYW